MADNKLDIGSKNILRLIRKGQDADGWAEVAPAVARFAFVEDNPHKLPSELYEFEPVGTEGRGRVRLTQAGNNVLDAMTYL